MTDLNREILLSATLKAVNAIESAQAALMGVDHDRFPHVRDVHNQLEDSARTLTDAVCAMPEMVPVTVIINTDTRDWDDPYIAFVDVPARGSAAAVRESVILHYWTQFADEEIFPVENMYEYWKEKGAVIQAILPGQVQVGWMRGGCDNALIEEVMRDMVDN